MVMTASKPAPPRLADMTREEAETVTGQIKENFDSLGNMLIAARDRKAYKVLGYRNFESYCQTEFGKSVRAAYLLIEDAKVLEQLEAKISENYEEKVTLKFPASHLRPLKDIADIDDKLKAIEYAQKLAASEGKKATKKHLEIAVFEISGKRSEDFRSAIQSLGFTKGVSVEVTKGLKKDRGFVIRVDKLGKIHIQFHNGGANSIPFDAADLRILTDAEKPATPLNEITASKGDRVLIFAQGWEGKKGTIYTRQEGKQTLVMVDGKNSPVCIAYVEMELVKEPDQKNANWESDLSWDTTKQTYYYFQKEDKIYSNEWPAGLTLTPYSHELSPIEFMANWEEKFAGQFFEFLSAPASNNTDALIEENQRLREQLAEAESAIQAMVNAASTASTASALEPSKITDFLLENTAEISTPGEAATHSDFLLENIADNSSREIEKELSPEILEQLESERNKATEHITRSQAKKRNQTNKKEIKQLDQEIADKRDKLDQLDKFSKFRVGQTVCHKRAPLILGKIIKLEFSQGGMPLIWVKYFAEGELEKTPTSELVSMIFTVDV